MSRKREKGQVLLIIVLIIAAVLSVGGAIFFESLTQTKVTKLQEESARALATAESLAEQALEAEGDITLQSGAAGAEGFSGRAKIVERKEKSFLTPLLFRDNQTTIYMVDFVTDPNIDDNQEIQDKIRSLLAGAPSPAAQAVEMKVSVNNPKDFEEAGFASSDCPSGMVVELGFVKITQNPEINYRIIECGSIIEGRPESDSRRIIMGQRFQSPEAHLLFVRILYKEGINFPGVVLKLERTDGGNWPAQGKTVESVVRAASGTTQTVTLFQSYLQLPASFFVTAANDDAEQSQTP